MPPLVHQVSSSSTELIHHATRRFPNDRIDLDHINVDFSCTSCADTRVVEMDDRLRRGNVASAALHTGTAK